MDQGKRMLFVALSIIGNLSSIKYTLFGAMSIEGYRGVCLIFNPGYVLIQDIDVSRIHCRCECIY